MKFRDEEHGEYWGIFKNGTDEEVCQLCNELLRKGFSVFVGQCDPKVEDSYVSRIIKGRKHARFPKNRKEAQMTFLARFATVGYVSARTWKRCQAVLRKK